MVAVKVKFFGAIKGLTDGPNTVVELDEDATVTDLLKELHKKYGKSFYDGVLSDANGLNGVKGHVKLFINGEEVHSQKFATTKVMVDGAVAETMLYVVSATTGG